MQAHSLISWSSLKPLQPAYALAVNVDLMVLRLEDDDAEQVVVMYGRCQHRGALMADAHIQGDKIVCGLHGSHYIYKTGINPRYLNKNLQKFKAWGRERSGFCRFRRNSSVGEKKSSTI